MSKQNDLSPVALYARVSSDRQDVDLSVAAQLRALRDYADRNGYLVVHEYIDEAESGRIADRPQFRKMLDEAAKPEAPFREILVWKFSRFTRKREHAVAFKSMLRRKGIRVVSITEHADDTPTGKLMEAIIESVDEFYSENLAEEVRRGMREAASRGFWMNASAPYGYRRVYVQDGAKKRPRLELNPPHDALVRRIFDLTLQGRTSLDILKTLNSEGIPSPNGKQWRKTTVHKLLCNEAYMGTLVWGQKARDGQEPVRVENAFPAIVSQQEFRRVRKLLEARAPSVTHPRRASSPYLLSGLAKCETCNKALTAAEAKSGKYTYYVCQSILKQGSGSCDTPRLNAKSFEDIIVSNIRDNILTESNIRDLVKLLDEEMDGVAREQRQNLETVEAELEEVKRKLDRIWHFVESTDLDMADASERILEHRHRREQLEAAAEEARTVLAERRELLDSADVVAAFAADMSEFLRTSELTETKAFVRSFVKEVLVRPGGATIIYSIPTPEDSPIGGADAAEIALGGGVRSMGYGGGAGGDRTLYLFNAIEALSQVSYSPTVGIYDSKGRVGAASPRALCSLPKRQLTAVELDYAAAASPFAGHHEVEVFAGVGPDAVAGAVQLGTPLGDDFAFQRQNAEQPPVVLRDVHDVVGVYVEEGRADELAGPGGDVLAVLSEGLHAVVLAVGHQHAVVAVNPDAVGQPELSGAVAGFSP